MDVPGPRNAPVMPRRTRTRLPSPRCAAGSPVHAPDATRSDEDLDYWIVFFGISDMTCAV